MEYPIPTYNCCRTIFLSNWKMLLVSFGVNNASYKTNYMLWSQSGIILLLSSKSLPLLPYGLGPWPTFPLQGAQCSVCQKGRRRDNAGGKKLPILAQGLTFGFLAPAPLSEACAPANSQKMQPPSAHSAPAQPVPPCSSPPNKDTVTQASACPASSWFLVLWLPLSTCIAEACSLLAQHLWTCSGSGNPEKGTSSGAAGSSHPAGSASVLGKGPPFEVAPFLDALSFSAVRSSLEFPFHLPHSACIIVNRSL